MGSVLVVDDNVDTCKVLSAFLHRGGHTATCATSPPTAMLKLIDIGAVAEAMVYGGDQGRVVRCRRCDAVLMAVVPTGTGTRVQLRGIAWLEVP